MAKLTKTQLEILKWLNTQPRGVVDVSDESVMSRLISRGLAFKFFESDGGELTPVWTITEAGRLALQGAKAMIEDPRQNDRLLNMVETVYSYTLFVGDNGMWTVFETVKRPLAQVPSEAAAKALIARLETKQP